MARTKTPKMKPEEEGVWSLGHRPDDDRLLGFGSLRPAPEPRPPHPIVRLVTAPFRLIAALALVPVRLLTWPFRRGDDAGGTDRPTHE